MATDWTLSTCCDTESTVFIIFYAAFALITLILGKWAVFKPMRLLSVFIHEFGHASTCWLTGGKVKKIEVNLDEGGITGYTGGCRCCIIPAGYVGT
jgi:Peptidase M50B-like